MLMNHQPCRVLLLTFGLSMFLADCSRHRDQKQANAHPAEQPSLVNSSSANPSLSARPFPSAAPRPEKTRVVGPERPSPFSSPLAAEQSEPQTPAGTRSADSLRSASRAQVAMKPFTMPATSAINLKGRTLSPALPPPPAIRQSAPEASQLPPFGKTMCYTATATYEPARPSGFQRVILKVPGLRRLNPAHTGGKGFVPPRPIQDIQFALPLDASPVLMQKKRMDLKASVDASGRVTSVELLSPPDEELVKLAAYAANRWRFAPAALNDQPVSGKIILHFSFDTKSAVQTAIDESKRR
jgi:TonB family protein